MTRSDPDLPALLALIQTAFASMDGRIDPPSSVHRLGLAALRADAISGALWAIGTPPRACVVLTPRTDHLHIGKLAVAQAWQGQGLARALIDQAEIHARSLGLPVLRLNTRVELRENHAAFSALGFRCVARSAHPGYNRPTSLTYLRAVPP